MTNYSICFEIYHRFKNENIFGEYEFIKIDFGEGIYAYLIRLPVFNKDHMNRATGIDFDFEKAFIKAVMEACEWYTSCYTNSFEKTNSKNDIKEKRIMNSDSINLFDELTINSQNEIQYSITYSHFESQMVYIPSQLIYGNYFYLDKITGEPLLRIPISTGLACHINKQASLLKSFAEIIERDNYTLYMYNKTSPKMINVSSNHRLNFLKKNLTSHGNELFFFDFTYDSPIKVIGSLIINNDKNWLRMGLASGLNIEECLYHSFFESYKQIFPIKHINKNKPFYRNNLYSNMLRTSELWRDQSYWSELDFLFNGEKINVDAYIKEENFINIYDVLPAVNLFFKKKNFGIYIKEFKNIFSKNVYIQKVFIPEMIPLYVNENMIISKLKRNKEFAGNERNNKLKPPVPFL